MKEVNRIKLESLKKESMVKKGYIGEYPMNFFSVVFMFEGSPSHEQVVEAIERYFNSHYKHYLENVGELPQFIDYKQINMKNYDKSRSNIADDIVYVKADFLVQVDVKHLVEHNQREKDFEAWIDDYMSISGSDADIERFGTEVNTIHQSNADKMKPFSKAVSKGVTPISKVKKDEELKALNEQFRPENKFDKVVELQLTLGELKKQLKDAQEEKLDDWDSEGLKNRTKLITDILSKIYKAKDELKALDENLETIREYRPEVSD